MILISFLSTFMLFLFFCFLWGVTKYQFTNLKLLHLEMIVHTYKKT